MKGYCAERAPIYEALERFNKNTVVPLTRSYKTTEKDVTKPYQG